MDAAQIDINELMTTVEGHYRAGRWEEAYPLLEEAIAAEPNPRRAARLKLELVKGYNYEDIKRGLRHAEAKRRLVDEAEAAVAGECDTVHGLALLERGMALHTDFIMAEGDGERELECFTRAAELLEKGGAMEEAAMATAMIGVHHHVNHLDRETAEPILLKAYEMAPSDGPSLARAEAARHLGQIRQELGDTQRGIEYLQESVDIREASGWSMHLPSAYHVLGYAKLEAGDFDGARRDLDKAIELAETIDAKLTVAMAKRNRADLDLALIAPAIWRRTHP